MRHPQKELEVAYKFHGIGRDAIRASMVRRGHKNIGTSREWQELSPWTQDGFIILARHALAHGYKPTGEDQS